MYKEPSVKKKAALAAAKAAAVKAEKVPSEMALKAATGPTGGAGLYDEDPLASAEGRKAAHKRPKNGGARSMRPRSAATGEVLVDTARSMRGSTVRHHKTMGVVGRYFKGGGRRGHIGSSCIDFNVDMGSSSKQHIWFR